MEKTVTKCFHKYQYFIINPSYGGINWNKLGRIIFTQLPPENIKPATTAEVKGR